MPTATSKLVLSDGPSSFPDTVDDEMDISFAFNDLPGLKPSIQIVPSLTSDYFAHAIAASPSHLLRHTQRIFFYYQQADSDGLYSALYDLFMALQDRGARLRRRLLQGSFDRLDEQQLAALSSWLEQGEPRDKLDMPFPNQSVLSRGITGIRDLVIVSHEQTAPDRDPLLEAREFIDYFQIDEARDLLERAILDHPEREELHLELIQLYQATRDHSGLQTMREKLSQLLPELPECWTTLGGSPLSGEKN